jgi:hypothetical protein
MEIKRWFGGYDTFVVEAENKTHATSKGMTFACQKYSWDSHNLNDVRCVKKLKPKRK